MIQIKQPALQIWGGVEYTCNRVRDRYFDQLALSGHGERLDDFDLIAGLGIQVLRHGLLWEHHHRDQSWKKADVCIDRMTQVGISPIIGLVHHGSGPPYTSLVDDSLPERLAAYAGAVAARYPFIERYTPVNEPHTTARFSCMYGIWYPHHMDRTSYLRALLRQVKGTVLSMEAVRKVRSDALLIQTEDIGRICSTPELSSLSDLLNQRRWLPFDLLCGRVERDHPMFDYLLENGIDEAEVLWFRDNPCIPDVIGVNYYLTSDRYLDHRVELFPEDRMSAEGNFVDIEAVRVWPDGIVGFDELLLEAWERFHLPVAITEVHLGGEVEEQIRWAAEAWSAAQYARHKGASCVAITFWAMLGSYFWDALVTRNNGHYQPGVFDVRGGSPSPTELADLVRQLSRGDEPRHSYLHHPGWWRSPNRISFKLQEELAHAR
ncbi:dTDP-4-dehydrorhamnose reductase [Acidisarcina polymorpha]|uniref:dTDP-4-dehydrorhamnose reductase n=1 Tax=Acidisarcina polymorpha TaxID=2211140 RepID=A0A2Z5FWH0_9BACT|nr:glycoside hydrolase [Acidisarcina polymorpha]AXC11229.1 dTDP-4-dehydrorhamnose reductase [Acidisarcina polymorpha]